MSELNAGTRLYIEETIDKMLADPKRWELFFHKNLTAAGIEPNLETTLSYCIGWISGNAYTLIDKKYPGMSDEELGIMAIKIDELLKRRVWELRQAFLHTKIDV